MATHRPGARWAVPAGLAAAVLGAGVLGPTFAAAQVDLPERSAEQLLTDLQTAQVDGYSGTVEHHADLGLPSLPDSMGGGGHPGGAENLDATSLLSGTHTLRVWAAAPDKARVAVHGQLGESAVITDGEDLWLWSSADSSATHLELPEHAGEHASDRAAELEDAAPSLTPERITELVLDALEPTTRVSSGPTGTVAGRPAYELVLEPATEGSLIDSVRIAVDATERVPTRVQVRAVGAQDPAIDVGFTEVTFSPPDDDVFTFTPPRGTTVEELDAAARPEDGSPKAPDHQRPGTAVVGTGWSAVLVSRTGATSGTEGMPELDGLDQLNGLGALVGSLPRVSGEWGSGRLLTSALFSALLTDDGRVLVGAVDGRTLQSAAADPAAALD